MRTRASSTSRTRNSILNLLTSLGGQILVTALKFVTRTVFIHTLGKEYLGINGLFSDILMMLSLTELGLDTAINYQLYRPLAEQDNKRVRVLMKFYKQAYRVIGAVILLLGLFIIPLLPLIIRDYDSLSSLGINASLVFILYLLQSASSYLFFAYRSAVMKANQKKYILDIADYGVTILTNVAQILILIYLHDFIIYTASLILSNISMNLVNAIIAKIYYPSFFEKEEDSLSGLEIKNLFKDCGALFVYKVNVVVLKATDNIVLSAFVGLAMVGLYSNYLLIFTTIQSLLNQVYTAVKASMGNLFVTEDIPKRYHFFQVMNYLTILLYGTAAVGIAVCADEMITTWVNDSYIIKQPFAILVGIEILFHGLQNNLGQIRNVSGAFRQMWYRPVIGVTINLIASVVLVQWIGIYGVLIGTILSYLLANFSIEPVIIHKYSFNNYKPVREYYVKNIRYIIVLVIICILDFYICRHFFVNHGWGSVVFHIIVVGVTVPTILTMIFGKSKESKYILSVAKRIVLRFINKLNR